MIRSTVLVPWLKQKRKETPIKRTVGAHFSRKALKLYDALTFNGLFDEWLLIRKQKSGFVRLARVR